MTMNGCNKTLTFRCVEFWGLFGTALAGLNAGLVTVQRIKRTVSVRSTVLFLSQDNLIAIRATLSIAQKTIHQFVEQARTLRVNRMSALRHDRETAVWDFGPEMFDLWPPIGSVTVSPQYQSV